MLANDSQDYTVKFFILSEFCISYTKAKFKKNRRM